MATKEERLEHFKKFVADHCATDAIREMALNVFEQGCDQGFADGRTAGASHTAKTMEFVNEALLGGRA